MVAISDFTIDPIEEISTSFCWNILDNFANIDKISAKKYKTYINLKSLSFSNIFTLEASPLPSRKNTQTDSKESHRVVIDSHRDSHLIL